MALTKQNDNLTGYETQDLLSQPLQVHEMTFSDNVKQMIIQQLTDMYSNPIEATVRETVSNAIDATVKARANGQHSKNAVIKSPSYMEPTLEVIDNGTGMNREELDMFFSDYGNSSKIMDMDAIGAKGLGAKAMLAYSPKATVDTIKDGRRIIISMERGEKSNLTKTILDEATDKPNGTTVKVPVLTKDIAAMSEAIQRYSTYAPQGLLNVDGHDVSIDDSYIKVKDIQIGVNNNGAPVYGKLWVARSGEHSDIVPSSVVRKLYYAYHSPAYGYNGTDNNRFLKEYAKLMLSGWDYTIDNKEYYRSSDKPLFIIEIVPGIVDFPASRDEITKNERFDELLSYINRSMGLWDSAADDETVITKILTLFNETSKETRKSIANNIILTTDLFDKDAKQSVFDMWPDLEPSWSETPYDSASSFYAVQTFQRSDKYLTSSVQYLRIGKDRSPHALHDTTLRGYSMQYVDRVTELNDLLTLSSTTIGEAFSNHPNVRFKMATKELAKTCSGIDDNEAIITRSTPLSDTEWAQYANTFDYNAWRSVPFSWVIDSPVGNLYGTPMYYRQQGAQLVIIKHDWEHAKKNTTTMLRKYASLIMKTKMVGSVVFYLITPDCSADNLAAITNRFKQEHEHTPTLLFDSAITYDELRNTIKDATAKRKKVDSKQDTIVDAQTITFTDTLSKIDGIVQLINAVVKPVTRNIDSTTIPDNAIVIFMNNTSRSSSYDAIETMGAIINGMAENTISGDWETRDWYIIPHKVRASVINELKSRGVQCFNASTSNSVMGFKSAQGYVVDLVQDKMYGSTQFLSALLRVDDTVSTIAVIANTLYWMQFKNNFIGHLFNDEFPYHEYDASPSSSSQLYKAINRITWGSYMPDKVLAMLTLALCDSEHNDDTRAVLERLYKTLFKYTRLTQAKATDDIDMFLISQFIGTRRMSDNVKVVDNLSDSRLVALIKDKWNAIEVQQPDTLRDWAVEAMNGWCGYE